MSPAVARPVVALVAAAIFALLPFARLAAEDIAYRPSNTYGIVTSDRLERPEGLAFDSRGNLYVADSGMTVLHKFDVTGSLVGRQGNIIRNGVNLRLTAPAGVAVAPNGMIYLADTAQRTVRVFDSAGTFTNSIGIEGLGDGEFQAPIGVATDASGNLYVTDRDSHRVQKFDSTGRFLLVWGDRGREQGQFLGPTGIAVDGSGNVYVADSRNHRVQKFDTSGRFLTQWGGQGSETGRFTEPRGIAADGSGNIYVADTGNRRIQKFSSDGTLVTSWASNAIWLTMDSSGNVVGTNATDTRVEHYSPSGSLFSMRGQRATGNGELRFPRGVWVDGSGTVTVADTGNHRIQQFNADGSFLRTWGAQGSGNGQFNSPSAVAADGSGNIYVADTGNHRVQKFDSTGRFVLAWGTLGNGDGQFNSPLALTVDSGNAVHVVDTGNRRIQRFDSSGQLGAAWGSAGLADGQFSNPTGIAVDLGGNVYVADFATAEGGNARVQKFDSGARFLAKWTSDGTGDLNPHGVTLTRGGQLFISERRRIALPFAQSGVDAIVKLDVGGALLQRFGTPGVSDGEIGALAGIAVDGGGNVYVADEDTGRVLKYTPVAAPPTPTATPRPGQPTPGPGLPPNLPPAPPTPEPVRFGAPALVEPPNGFRLPGPATTLKWDQPFTTTQFHVQVLPHNGDGPALDLIIGDKMLVGQSRWTLHQSIIGQGPYLLLPDQTYTWRVRATESPEPQLADGAQWGPWSPAWTFRTPRASTTGLHMIAPPDGAVIPSSTIRLTWDNAASEVFYYEVQVSADPAFETAPERATAFVWWNLIHGGLTVPLNSWITPPLEPGRTYYWRVRPRIQGDGTPLPWSPTRRFTASASGLLPAPGLPQPPGGPGQSTPAAPFTLTSTAFQEGGAIPAWATCDGVDSSLPLEWSNMPAGTRALALLMDDLDALGGALSHWVVYNLPSTVTSLAPGLQHGNQLANGGLQGRNGMGGTGYDGPCPPAGTAHRYRFTLYALSDPLATAAGVSRDAVAAAMQGRTLGQTQLTGRYGR